MAFKMKGFIPQGNKTMGNMGRNGHAAKAMSAAAGMRPPMMKKSAYKKDGEYDAEYAKTLSNNIERDPNSKNHTVSARQQYEAKHKNKGGTSASTKNEEKQLDKGKNLDVGAGIKAGKGFVDRLKNRGVKSAVSNAAPVRYARTVGNTLGPEYVKAGKAIAKGVKGKAKKVKGYLANLKNKAKEKLSSAMTKHDGAGAKKTGAVAHKSVKLGAGTSRGGQVKMNKGKFTAEKPMVSKFKRIPLVEKSPMKGKRIDALKAGFGQMGKDIKTGVKKAGKYVGSKIKAGKKAIDNKLKNKKHSMTYNHNLSKKMDDRNK